MDFILLGWGATVVLWGALELWRFLEAEPEDSPDVLLASDVNLNGGIVHVDFATPPESVPFTSTIIFRLDGEEVYRTFVEPRND